MAVLTARMARNPVDPAAAAPTGVPWALEDREKGIRVVTAGYPQVTPSAQSRAHLKVQTGCQKPSCKEEPHQPEGGSCGGCSTPSQPSSTLNSTAREGRVAPAGGSVPGWREIVPFPLHRLSLNLPAVIPALTCATHLSHCHHLQGPQPVTGTH